ncbi:MAG: hypothetical protein N2044_13270, partial [Cyclobacteriaceae bacterium]|nr:hypothetical protein [Cyclobacteriaceae bacterium]
MLRILRKSFFEPPFPYAVLRGAAFLVFLVILSHSSFAQTTRTWTQTGGGNWATAGNWSPAGVPVDGDDVIIPVSNTGGTITNVPNITLRDSIVQGTGTCT